MRIIVIYVLFSRTAGCSEAVKIKTAPEKGKGTGKGDIIAFPALCRKRNGHFKAVVPRKLKKQLFHRAVAGDIYGKSAFFILAQASDGVGMAGRGGGKQDTHGDESLNNRYY